MKKAQRKRVVWMCSLFIMMFAVTTLANAQDFTDETGDYYTAIPYQVDIDADGTNDAYIFRPALWQMSDNSHPIVVFCVGTSGGDPTNFLYKPMLKSFASHGIVVIAGNNGNQVEGDSDYDYASQATKALLWLMNQSPFSNKLNTNKVVSMGHSQGGAAAIHVALNLNTSTQTVVTAITALMPGWGTEHSNLEELTGETPQPPDWAKIVDPILYVAAENDVVIWPYILVEPQYLATANAAADPNNNNPNPKAWFGVHQGSGHLQLPDTMQETVRAWLYAHLYDNDPNITQVIPYSDDAKNVFYDLSANDAWTFQYDTNWIDQARSF